MKEPRWVEGRNDQETIKRRRRSEVGRGGNKRLAAGVMNGVGERRMGREEERK